MKTFYTILKVLAALAAIAGIVYVVATYGDKIVAWARGLLHRNRCDACDGECDCCDCDCDCESHHIFAEDNSPVIADGDFED
jgi:hypothetical protein